MARATSGLGQFRGKVGSVVFRVNQGQQIASAYQPAVRNPKSNLQTAQRNKMYLASQLSKAVPREDIIGLAPIGSARDRRNAFIRNIINNTSSILDGKLFTSRVLYDKVLFSDGINIITSVVRTQDNVVSIAVDRITTEEEYNRLAVKVISFAVNEIGIESYKSYWLDLPAFAEIQNSPNGLIPIQGIVTEGLVTYFIPVLLKDNVRYSRETKTLVQLVDNGYFAITGEYNISNAVLSWGKSYAFASGDFGEIVPPSTDGDEVVNPDGPNFPNLG